MSGFTQPTMATNNISLLDPYPNDNQGLTAAQLQLKYDQFGIDAKAFLINLISELQSTTLGSSGAENIGSATIAGITGNTVYTQIANMLSIAQSAQAGTILPGVITNAMHASDVKIGSLALLNTTVKTDVVSAINEAHLQADTTNITILNQNRLISMGGMF